MRSKLIQSPINPGWLIPEGWENILGVNIDYRLGAFVLRLWRVQLNQHAGVADPSKPHAHQHHQLLYYQRGSGWLESGRERYVVAKGGIFFVPAGCEHHFKADSPDAARCLAIDFGIDEMPRIDLGGLPMQSEVAVLLSLLHTDEPRPFQLRSHDQSLMDETIQNIVRENEGRELGFATLIQAQLLRLMALCLRATCRAQGFGKHFRHTAWRHHLVAERAGALIAAHATREPELTLGELARLCGASRNHLNRILKRQTGRTFHQLLLGERLERARTLLERGEMNCTEVAFASGFNDSNYFSRAFRKTFGFPPSQLVRST